MAEFRVFVSKDCVRELLCRATTFEDCGYGKVRYNFCPRLKMKKFKAPMGAHGECGTDFYATIIVSTLMGESRACAETITCNPLAAGLTLPQKPIE